MAPKYSHVKKRPAPRKKQSNKDALKDLDNLKLRPFHGKLNPQIDRSLTQTISAVAKLEKTIARILFLRYEQDVARLFSTRLYMVSLIHLPTFVMRCVSLGGPGWAVHNADNEEIKDFFRAAICMDLRQAGERVAAKSVLWSYTALRQFALSNNIPICSKRGIHSVPLLPQYDSIKAHLDTLESLPPPVFEKPPHLGPLVEGEKALEEACERRFGNDNANANGTGKKNTKEKEKDRKGKTKEKENLNHNGVGSDDRDRARSRNAKDVPLTLVLSSYSALIRTLWNVAAEFDVRGYGLLLKEKLEKGWCECGCTTLTEELGMVCEGMVRAEEEWVSSFKNKEEDAVIGYGYGGKYREDHPYEPGARHDSLGPDLGPPKTKGKVKPRPKAKGKQREWDGRGSGVYGWDTPDEEDIWEIEMGVFGGGGGLDSGPGIMHNDDDDHGHEHLEDGGHRHGGKGGDISEGTDVDNKKDKEREKAEVESISRALGLGLDGSPLTYLHPSDLRSMSLSEVLEWRYLRAEKLKEAGNGFFRKAEMVNRNKSGAKEDEARDLYKKAVEKYLEATKIEPEMPVYQLNLGMGLLRLGEWQKAEEACTKALSQHRSPKGYFRRAKARKMMRKFEAAEEDLRAVLRLQPSNTEARNELISLDTPTKRVQTNSDSKLGGKKAQLESSSSSVSVVASGSSSSASASASACNSSAPTASTKVNLSSPTPIPTLSSFSSFTTFPRTPMDDRKMKVVTFPASFPPPGAFPSPLDVNSDGTGVWDFLNPSAGKGKGFNAMDALAGLGIGVGGVGGVGVAGIGPFPPGMSPPNYYYATYGYPDGYGGYGTGVAWDGLQRKDKEGKDELHHVPHGPHGHGCTCGSRYRGGSRDSAVGGYGYSSPGNNAPGSIGGHGGEEKREPREKTKEEKERADRAWKRQKELEKLRATQGVIYPGWERYVIKRFE